MRLIGPAILICFLAAPTASAATDGFLVEFNFDKLAFNFYPGGLGSAQHQTGSGLQVFAQNVRIEGDSAKDLRHCIDGWSSPDCSYGSVLPPGIGNKNGQVEPTEVTTFQGIAQAGLKQIEKIARLSDMLEKNITVDGFAGGVPRVAEFVLRDAVGDVNSGATIQADVRMEVGYENDKNSARHELRARHLDLKLEGFSYAAVEWRVVSDAKWSFKPDQTKPEGEKSRVDQNGWTSDQTVFETATDQDMLLVVEKDKKKGSPGFELAFLVAAVGAFLFVRRRA